MKTNELRIGNWVQVENDYERIKMIYIDSVLCVLDDMNNPGIEQQIKDIKPIPLTREWLEKFGFGFEIIDGDTGDDYDTYLEYGWILKGDYDIVIEYHSFKSNDNNTGFYITECQYEMNIMIKYVHQLQNLYFALTGEELTIKEKS